MKQEQAVSRLDPITAKKENPFADRNFLYLFIGALFSSPGYYVYLIGSEWLMLSITGNRFYFGMLFVAASIPRLIFMMYGGAAADRLNKRTILFISDLSRAFLVSVLLVLVWLDAAAAWHLIVLSVFFGISDAFSHPSMNSLVAEILPKESLQRGNGTLQMTQQLSPIIGPAAGGTLIVTIGFKGIFTVAAVILVIAAWTVARIKLVQEEGTPESKKGIFHDIKLGFNYVKQNNLLLSVMSMAFLLNFFITGPLSMGIPLLVKDVYQENALGLTAMEMAFGIGALGGALLMTVMKSVKRPGLLVLYALLVQTALFTLLGVVPSLLFAVPLLFVIGILMQVVNIPILTVVQSKTDPRMLGRVMSLLMTVATGLVPVSYLVTSLIIGAGAGIGSIIFFAGLAVCIVSILSFSLKELRIFTYD
ncbi:MFS transporter [Bacillus marinisedimentorum]|uniref:MFS transporter n=1 Tax=Bacillus marinisedimentorum TaxID=1821260 RepID=UPI000872118F|nr:MFS transporter [Bacillus marinisedimentorum]